MYGIPRRLRSERIGISGVRGRPFQDEMYPLQPEKYLALQRPSNRKSELPPSAPCDTPENREWLRFKDLVDYG